MDIIPLPGLTKDNCSVVFHRSRDSNIDKFNFIDSAKCLVMTSVSFATMKEYLRVIYQLSICTNVLGVMWLTCHGAISV
ncbi:uncharacterized protein LOC119644655 [Glossina fuscipes]|uniref:Uncharacterized protein LOC119644655 n=1 Tax=Glossina fuscipes TaxID=7396 RepID=A0A9C5ZEG9_9MUSC|nr:uncharacterized protein LOC119644655 [Glossina fuscipes]